MKCQILFPEKNKKNKKNINLSSAEFAHRAVKVKSQCGSKFECHFPVTAGKHTS